MRSREWRSRSSAPGEGRYQAKVSVACTLILLDALIHSLWIACLTTFLHRLSRFKAGRELPAGGDP